VGIFLTEKAGFSKMNISMVIALRQGMVIVKYVVILIVRVLLGVVALLKGGSEGRHTNLVCSVLFCESKNALLSKRFNLLWHLSNALSASALEAS